MHKLHHNPTTQIPTKMDQVMSTRIIYTSRYFNLSNLVCIQRCNPPHTHKCSLSLYHSLLSKILELVESLNSIICEKCWDNNKSVSSLLTIFGDPTPTQLGRVVCTNCLPPSYYHCLFLQLIWIYPTIFISLHAHKLCVLEVLCSLEH